jgi:hypothetical protein
MSSNHTAVWIDHREAQVFRVEPDSFDKLIVQAPHHELRHPQGEAELHNHPDDEHRFFAEVAKKLRGSNTVLILGPANAKLHFRDYVKAHASTLSFGVSGVETVDHPSDNQIVAFVREYFLSGHGQSAHPR